MSAVTKTSDEQILESLGAINQRLAKVEVIEKAVGEQKDQYAAATQLIAEVQKGQVELRKQLLETRAARVRRGGEVSEECARFIGGIGLVAALKAGEAISANQRQMAEAQVKSILGIEAKAALTS